jgi:hypothetical protein
VTQMVITAEKLEALRMLATLPGGCTVPDMMAEGYAIGMLHDLISERLASAHQKNVGAGRRAILVTRLRITDSGGWRLRGDPEQ